jgi:hypothetical protein
MLNATRLCRLSLSYLIPVKKLTGYEDVWRNRGIAPPFLTSALDRGEWSASRPSYFTSGEESPGTHWIGGWVDPKAGLDATGKKQFLALLGTELRPYFIPVYLNISELMLDLRCLWG